MKYARRLGLAVLVASTVFLAACGGAGGSAPPSPPPAQQQVCPGCSIRSVNHVVIMLQENRSFDDYFGQMTAYRAANGIPISSSDGKINDLSSGAFSNTNFQLNQVIPSHHSLSVCTEDLTPDWGPAHIMMNHTNPAAAGPGSPMDGFVSLAFAISRGFPSIITDQTGARAMGFFDSNDLNYYYFMASNFAMGDAFYSPAPTRTAVNRLYLFGATSQGYAHEPTGAQVSSKPIVQELDEKGVSWKVYVTDPKPSFLTYLSFFTYFSPPDPAAAAAVQAHVAPLNDAAKAALPGTAFAARSSYIDDLKNGTLPAVAFIETGMFTGRDEHPSNVNKSTGFAGATNVQVGAAFVSGVINALMASSAWKDSVFFFAFDEGGGVFDHVPPISVPSPDGIPPKDLAPGEIPGDFTITGFRVPNFVVSSFAKKNFVSHTPMDFTAYLKFIETRFGLSPLNARDAAMPTMEEFFDFTNQPWLTPPTPPAQNQSGTCNFAAQ